MATALRLRTLGKSLLPRMMQSNSAGKRFAQLAGAGILCYGLQKKFGTAQDFFDHRFVTMKKSEDLADFYGSEDFMEIFCIFPFMVNFMMRGSTFDDDGVIHAWGLTGPGHLEVSIEFQEREEDTDGDGEPDTIAWFNKREQFKEVSPFGNLLLWQMTQNFGYNRKTDGTCEVYHHGEHFEGLFPIRFLFQLHAKYVAWATKRYIESKEFGGFEREEEAEVLRQNIPLFAFKELIASLTVQVEKAREENKDNAAMTAEHDKTLAALRRMSMRSEREVALPHFQTIRRHGTLQKHVTLVLEDQESAQAIRSAMKHISRNNQRTAAQPVETIGELQRRVTLREQELEEAVNK
ncbi:hypothetical protein MPSEU_001024400 [Mayamaea pseudoterrestris]|nr:hypothetical protein MPSEU_001024400 [Mayamaea pseudoterrestris]